MNSNYSTKLREIHKTVCLSSLFNLTHANLDWGIRMVRGIHQAAPNPSPENKIIPRLACTHYHLHTKGENSKSAQLTCSVFVLKTLSSNVSPTFLLSYIRLFNLEYLWPGVRFMFLYRTLLKRRCIFYSKFYSKQYYKNAADSRQIIMFFMYNNFSNQLNILLFL